MAELKQDPSQALLSLLYPLLGGEANVASLTRRGNRISAQLKDESLADPAALAALPSTAAVSVKNGRLRLELTEQAYEKSKKENLLMAVNMMVLRALSSRMLAARAISCPLPTA